MFYSDYEVFKLLEAAGYKPPQLHPDDCGALQTEIQYPDQATPLPLIDVFNSILLRCFRLDPRARPSSTALHGEFLQLWHILKRN